MKLKILLILTLLLLVNCASKNAKRSEWWREGGYAVQNQYVGVGILSLEQKDSYESARKDAVNKIVNEIGVRIKSEFLESVEEKDKSLEVYTKSMTQAEGTAFIEGLTITDKHIEKINKNEETLYRVYVLLKIPPGEIKRARERRRKYELKMFDKAQKKVDNARETQSRDPYTAKLELRTAVRMLTGIENENGKALKTEIQALLESIERTENPMVKLDNLESSSIIMEKNPSIVDIYGNDYKPSILNLKDRIKIKVFVKEPAYLYIMSYDLSTNEPRLLFPNKFEKNNLIKDEVIYPENSCFTVEPPGGSNTIYIIVSKDKVAIPTFGRQDYVTFTDSELWDFIYNLETVQFDIQKVDFYING